jgi:hypothetical protein
VTTPTLPRRKLRPNRLPMGAARWLLGRDPELTDNGGVRHGSIVRWRHLIVHKSGLEDWHAFLAQFWAEHRAAVLDWHAARGFAIPARRLGHEAERAFLRRSRHRGPGQAPPVRERPCGGFLGGSRCLRSMTGPWPGCSSRPPALRRKSWMSSYRV